jgi:hypothetical protein
LQFGGLVELWFWGTDVVVTEALQQRIEFVLAPKPG